MLRTGLSDANVVENDVADVAGGDETEGEERGDATAVVALGDDNTDGTYRSKKRRKAVVAVKKTKETKITDYFAKKKNPKKSSQTKKGKKITDYFSKKKRPKKTSSQTKKSKKKRSEKQTRPPDKVPFVRSSRHSAGKESAVLHLTDVPYRVAINKILPYTRLSVRLRFSSIPARPNRDYIRSLFGYFRLDVTRTAFLIVRRFKSLKYRYNLKPPLSSSLDIVSWLPKKQALQSLTIKTPDRAAGVALSWAASATPIRLRRLKVCLHGIVKEGDVCDLLKSFVGVQELEIDFERECVVSGTGVLQIPTLMDHRSLSLTVQYAATVSFPPLGRTLLQSLRNLEVKIEQPLRSLVSEASSPDWQLLNLRSLVWEPESGRRHELTVSELGELIHRFPLLRKAVVKCRIVCRNGLPHCDVHPNLRELSVYKVSGEGLRHILTFVRLRSIRADGFALREHRFDETPLEYSFIAESVQTLRATHSLSTLNAAALRDYRKWMPNLRNAFGLFARGVFDDCYCEEEEFDNLPHEIVKAVTGLDDVSIRVDGHVSSRKAELVDFAKKVFRVINKSLKLIVCIDIDGEGEIGCDEDEGSLSYLDLDDFPFAAEHTGKSLKLKTNYWR